jgi:hypothetical protein
MGSLHIAPIEFDILFNEDTQVAYVKTIRVYKPKIRISVFCPLS